MEPTYHEDSEVGEVVEPTDVPALSGVLEGAALVRPRGQTSGTLEVPEDTARVAHVPLAAQSLRHHTHGN